jgi:hypothetical protein
MESSRNLAGMSVVDRSRDDLRRMWGITPGYWLWPTPIKILFVIDGRINLTSESIPLAYNPFGLGYVLNTLRDPLAWWVRFEVDVARRGDKLSPDDLGGPELPYKYEDNFKFTQIDLDEYHQVWFFGDMPNFHDGADGTTDNAIGAFALEDAELKLVAKWMDRGGGVFATGDHSILGASMCSGIPRVRTMRKWKHAQGVPTRDGPARHETLQHIAGSNSDPERDTVLQPLELVYRRVAGPLPFLRPLVPHPLLCSPQGVIDRFPDHMHEGEVIADDFVQLDLTVDILDYHRPEYPFVIPEFLAAGAHDVGALRPRPRPHVIAYGQTTNNYFVPPVEVAAKLRPSLLSKRFGLVGAYDGDSVGLGRVVVDSTWHHWLSYNVAVIEKDNKPAYQKMQAYYRNVGMWLATPAQRKSMLISGTWGVLTGSAPVAFSTKDSPWQIGERVLATLGLTVSPCMMGELVGPFLDQELLAASSARSEPTESEPSWSGLPEDLVNRALVGGLGSALLDLALDDQEKRVRGQRPRLNSEAIRQRAVDGQSRGQALLRKAIGDAATAISAVHATLAARSTPRPIDLRIPIDVRRLRVVAETLQFPEPSDPVLIGGHVTFTIRIRLDESIVAHQILEGVKVPAFEARGCVIDLSRDVGEVEVQSGESLSIEVLVGSRTSKQANPEVMRFSDTLRGDASNWIGKSVPARSQAWRLWYRIEESGPPYHGSLKTGSRRRRRDS